MYKLIMILLVLSFFTIRPAALGSSMSGISIAFQLIAIVIYGVIYKEKITFNKEQIKNIAIIIVFWIYVLFHAFVNESIGLEFVLKATILSIITAISFFVMLNNEILNKKFFNIIFMILKISIISWVITVIISLFIPIDSLQIGKLPLDGYENSGKIYFPCTILYGFMTLENIRLPRLLILFREAGITQMVLIWFLFNLKSYNLNTFKNKIILIIGVIGTFSTSGIFLLIATCFIKLILLAKNLKSLLKIVLIGTLIPIVLIFTPSIGLRDKMITHGASISDRSISMVNGIEKFIKNPFGTGFYSDVGIQNVNINFIASMYTIGIVGIILYMSIFIVNNKNKRYVICMFPILMTIFFMQPLIDAPMIYIFLFANYAKYNQEGILDETSKIS